MPSTVDRSQLPERIRGRVDVSKVRWLTEQGFSLPVAVAATAGALVLDETSVANVEDDVLVAWLVENLADPGHPDIPGLVTTLDGLPFIRHPYVHGLFHSAVSSATTWAVKLLVERRAVEMRDWATVLMLREKPWRPDMLWDLHDEPELADQEWWSLVGEVWVRSENQSTHPLWDDIWASTRTGRDSVMSPVELDSLEAIQRAARPIRLWRGYTLDGDDPDGDELIGWSWTSDRECAEWFARRWTETGERRGFVATVEVPPTALLAFFDYEDEFVVDRAWLCDNESLVSTSPVV